MKKQLTLALAIYSTISLSSCNGKIFGSSVEEIGNSGVNNKVFADEDAFFEDDLQTEYADSIDLNGSETKLTHFYFKNKLLNVYLNSKTKIRVISKPYQVYYDSLRFELSDPSFGYVDEKGYLVAEKIGSFVLTAYGPDGKSDFCDVNVYSGALEKIEVPESLSLTIGEKEECDFSYSVFPEYAQCKIKCFLEDPSVATIIDNHLVASKAGYTRVIFYNDANDNNFKDKNEISSFSYLTVHDFTNVTNSISPTHSLNGKTTYQCSCGCGATRNVVIPATKHTFDEGVITLEPTCTLAGERKKTCTDSTCDYHYEEVISPLGHTPSEEKHADRKHRAALGTHFEKTKYFYDCSVCHGFSDETFTRDDDYSNYFTTNILPEYYGDNKEGLKYVLSIMEKAADSSIYYSNLHRPFHLYLDVGWLSKFDYDWMMVSALGSGKTAPFVGHTNDRAYRSGPSFEFKFDYKQEEIDDFWEAFGKVENEVSALIRDDATDIEKALLIMLYICNDIYYNFVGFLPDTVKYKNGQCHDYANYFLYLAHRFDLPSYYVLGRMPQSYYDKNPNRENIDHAWVNVCIDGTWYMIDPTWCDGVNIDLDYFCVENDDYEHSRRLENGNPTCVSIKNGNLNRQMIQLYKNNRLAGIYYDMNKVIENINDSSADYKIILGIGIDGVANIGLTAAYYKKEYTTTKTSCSFKSLKIERCKINGEDSIPTFKAPTALLNLPNISFSNVNAVKQ